MIRTPELIRGRRLFSHVQISRAIVLHFTHVALAHMEPPCFFSSSNFSFWVHHSRIFRDRPEAASFELFSATSTACSLIVASYAHLRLADITRAHQTGRQNTSRAPDGEAEAAGSHYMHYTTKYPRYCFRNDEIRYKIYPAHVPYFFTNGVIGQDVPP